jgi:hypothetical protein
MRSRFKHLIIFSISTIGAFVYFYTHFYTHVFHVEGKLLTDFIIQLKNSQILTIFFSLELALIVGLFITIICGLVIERKMIWRMIK